MITAFNETEATVVFEFAIPFQKELATGRINSPIWKKTHYGGNTRSPIRPFNSNIKVISLIINKYLVATNYQAITRMNNATPSVIVAKIP